MLHAPQHVAPVERHVVQHLRNRVPVFDVRDAVAVAAQGDLDRVRVAEEVVQVAEDLLVRPDQERAEVIGLAIGRMQVEHMLDVLQVGELVELPVAVARDVGQGALAGRLLVVSVQRHDRKQLPHGPGVGHRLEEGEVAEVRVRQRPLQAFQLLGHALQAVQRLVEARAAREEELLGLPAARQVEVAEVEQLLCLLAEFHGVVIRLEQVVSVDELQRLVQLRNDLVIVLARRLDSFLGHPVGVEDIEDQHGVVRHQGPAGLGHDDGLGDIALPARLRDERDDVVGVLLHRVVHGGVEVSVRPVVVDGQATAHVEVAHARTHRLEFDEDPRPLAERVLEDADGRHLAADVEVQQLEAVEHALPPQELDGLHDLVRGEPELGAAATGLGPVAGTARQ